MQANFKVKLSEKRTTLFSVFFPLLGLSVKGKSMPSVLSIALDIRLRFVLKTTGIVFSYTQLRHLQRFCLRK